MRIKFICPCGLENYTLEDWLAHWKYAVPRPGKLFGKRPKIRAVWLFLNTRVVIERRKWKP